MRKKLIYLMTFVLLLGLSSTSQATDYYVSPSGNDNNSGTSPEQAWQTIAHVNDVTFSDGDSVLFEGGQTFTGGIYVDVNDGGTAANPLTFGSYGTGRATISSVAGQDGFEGFNRAGLEIKDLKFVGSGWSTSDSVGIVVWTDLPGNVKLPYLRIDNVDITEYSKNAIRFGGWNSAAPNSGLKDVKITNTDMHHIGDIAIWSMGYPERESGYANEDVYIGDCEFYDCPGTGPPKRLAGDGIVLFHTDGAIIEYCLAYNMGEDSGGMQAIWAYDVNNVVIQFCEAYNIKTGKRGGDGGGFDLDGGCNNSIMQYNYSHDCHGASYLICEYGSGRGMKNNICRYNISENDGQASSKEMGPVYFYAPSSDPLYNTLVYGNTFYASTNTRGAVVHDYGGGYVYNTEIYNNIFYTAPGKRVIHVPDPATYVFKGNCYWSSGDDLTIEWGGNTYTSLASWRSATGQEMHGGNPVGFETDPCLVNPGGGGTIGDPCNLASLTAYKLKENSPMINAALDYESELGIDPGEQDFYGSSIPINTYYDVGAHEYGVTGPDNDPPTPDPMTWATVPYATGDSSIAMEATTATDPSGVEYYFDCTTTGGHDSGWQNDTSYEDTDLNSSTQYCYQVKARDKSPNKNETGWSTTECATTTAPDTTPPSPDPMTWATVPYATGAHSIAMVATTATDESGVEYFFDCTTTGGNDSGWQDSTSYTDTGLSAETQYCYKVQARDKSSNQNATAWSTTECATTQSEPGGLPWSDGFESGDFETGGWTTSGEPTVGSGEAHTGSYGAKLPDTCWIEKALSTEGYTNIHVKCWTKVLRFKGEEYLYVEWYDGSGWHELGAIQYDEWASHDYTCGSGADNNPSFKVRFRTNDPKKSDYAKLDDVEITGTAQ